MKIIVELNRQQNKNTKILLEKNLDNLGINKIYIQKFLMMLWENPKLMFNLLNNADLKELKENLAPFIVDNFYNNYLSGNYVENNLLYLFTLMLKDEIDKLSDLEQVLSFLDNSRCGILLEQLIKKIDVQIYFKKMIIGTVARIENCSSRKINFNVNEINKKLSWLKSERNIENNNDILKNAKDSYKHRNNSSSSGEPKVGGNFPISFLTDINIQYLEKIKKDDKFKENEDLIGYFEKLIEDLNIYKNPELYANSTLIQTLYNSSSPTDILAIYKEQISEIISFINNLIEDLTSNTFLIPYSVKCICKIIFSLIKQKFKNIRTVEINAFVSKFFLGKLLIPIISSPTNNAFLTDFVISENTLKNIRTTNIILSKLFSGYLFINNTRDGSYTSFNKYFLEKMPQVLFFFQKAIEVQLPPFIENFLQNKLGDNFEYDYFEQNKESIYANVSMTFRMNNIECLIKIIKNKSDFFESKKDNKKTDKNVAQGTKDSNETKEKNDKSEKLKLIYSKLENGEVFQNIKSIEDKLIKDYSIKLQAELELEKKKDKNKKEKPIPFEVECHYLFFEEIYENKYKYIFKLKNNESDYYIDLKSLKSSSLTEEQRILINVKNYLCSTLGNYRLLNISDFSQDKIKNTIDILEEIKNCITLPNFILNNNTIPSEWYINSLLDSLPLLEKNYKDNDFLKFYREIYQDLNKSIEELNFNFLIVLRNRIKFIDKAKDYYRSIENSAKEIIINEKIKLMAENIFLPVEVVFKYDGDNSNYIFKIKFSNIKEKIFENKTFIQDTKKDTIIFRTIESFASNFPNLVEYQIYQDENPLEMMANLKMSKYIKEYFQIIREKIIKKNSISEEEYESLYQSKIIDYFMSKIYDKIYPIEPETKDTEIYTKATTLSWVEPNLIINKDYIYETSLPDIMHQFQNVTSARTPQKKFSNIQKILTLINNLIIFNEGDKKDISLDDVTPVLFYIFIKAHPYKIYTDLEFIKLFLDSKKGVYSFNIKQMESAINMVLNCNENNFGLTKEEFVKKCNNSARNIKNK